MCFRGRVCIIAVAMSQSFADNESSWLGDRLRESDRGNGERSRWREIIFKVNRRVRVRFRSDVTAAAGIGDHTLFCGAITFVLIHLRKSIVAFPELTLNNGMFALTPSFDFSHTAAFRGANDNT